MRGISSTFFLLDCLITLSLTLFGTGSKIYVKWRGCSPPPPSKHQKSLWKTKNFFFAFQIGHIEIGKVTKFGVIWRPFWGSQSWFLVGLMLKIVKLHIKKWKFSNSTHFIVCWFYVIHHGKLKWLKQPLVHDKCPGQLF